MRVQKRNDNDYFTEETELETVEITVSQQTVKVLRMRKYLQKYKTPVELFSPVSMSPLWVTLDKTGMSHAIHIRTLCSRYTLHTHTENRETIKRCYELLQATDLSFVDRSYKFTPGSKLLKEIKDKCELKKTTPTLTFYSVNVWMAVIEHSNGERITFVEDAKRLLKKEYLGGKAIEGSRIVFHGDAVVNVLTAKRAKAKGK